MFVLYCALSVIWSDYPDVAFKRWIKSLGDYVMILIVLTDREPSNAIKQVLARVGFLLLPLSVLLIKYYPDLGRSYAAHWEGTQYFVGVAADKNMLGMTCLFFGLAASWRFLQELTGSSRVKILLVHGTILGMALWLLYMANSITSLSCFVLTTGLMAGHMFLKMARRPGIVHLMTIVVLMGCFSVLFVNAGGGLLKTMGRDPTLTGRTEIWGHLLDLSENPIVGTGFESFWLGKRLERLWAIPSLNHINEAHNGYLELYLNLGWVGLTLLAIVIVTGYSNVVRLLSRDPEAGRLRLAYLVAAAAYNFTEAAIRTADLMWIALLLAVFAVPKARVPGVSDKRLRVETRLATEPVEETVLELSSYDNHDPARYF